MDDYSILTRNIVRKITDKAEEYTTEICIGYIFDSLPSIFFLAFILYSTNQ